MGFPSRLRERGYEVRDRLLGSSRFQRWCTRLPLLRGVARRRAGALFDLCAGFVYSQILQACVRLELFERLKAGPQPLESLAAAARVSPEAMRTLLNAAAALDLVQWRGAEGACGLGSAGATLLGIAGLPAVIAHHQLLYADLEDPLTLLREPGRATRLQTYWAYAGSAARDALCDADVAPYSAFMSATQAFLAAQILEVCDLGAHRVLLDVGGGDGSFAARAAAHHQRLHVVCFDLPPVAARAAQRFVREGLGARGRAVGGDFLTGPLPSGADAAALVRVLHDHGDAAALRILQAVRAALPDQGTLIVAEPLAGHRAGARVADAYFGMYLLAMRSGRPRSAAELAALLRAAGFTALRAHATRLPAQLQVLSAVAASRSSVKKS